MNSLLLKAKGPSVWTLTSALVNFLLMEQSGVSPTASNLDGQELYQGSLMWKGGNVFSRRL